jgi:hypothetical protein
VLGRQSANAVEGTLLVSVELLAVDSVLELGETVLTVLLGVDDHTLRVGVVLGQVV